MRLILYDNITQSFGIGMKNNFFTFLDSTKNIDCSNLRIQVRASPDPLTFFPF